MESPFVEDHFLLLVRSGHVLRDLVHHARALNELAGSTKGPVVVPIQLRHAKAWIRGVKTFEATKSGIEPSDVAVQVMLKSVLNPEDEFVERTIEDLQHYEVEDFEAGYIQISFHAFPETL